MWLACKFSVIYILVATVWNVDGVSIAREALPTSSPGIQRSEAQQNQPRVVPPNTVLNPSEANHIPDSKGPMMPPQPPFGTNQMPQQFMMPPPTMQQQNRPPPEMMMMSSPPPMTTTHQQQIKRETMQGNVTTTMLPSMLNSTRASNNTRREADRNSTTTTPVTTTAHGVENLARQAVPPQQALGAPPPGMVPFNPMAPLNTPMMMNQQPVFIDQMGRVMMLVPHQAFFDPTRNAFVVRDNNMPQQLQGPQGPPVPQMMMPMQAPMQLFPMPMGQQPMQPMFIPGQMGPQQQVPFGFAPNMPQQSQQQPFPSRTEEQKPQLNSTITRH